MLGYLVSIENDEGVIEISSENEGEACTVNSVEFKMNTIDDTTRNRSDEVREELTICGNIYNENKDNTLNMLKWAIDSNNKTVYRTVDVKVYDTANMTGNVLRHYQLANMFVIDYSENKPNKDSKASEALEYTMKLAQKAGKHELGVYTN